MSKETQSLSIEGKDIILRTYESDDVDKIYSISQEEEVKKFLPDWDVPKALRHDWMANYEIPENNVFIDSIANGGRIGALRLRMGIILKETGEFIGWCCSGIKEELEEPNREILYAISNQYRNKGYTTQAVREFIRYLFESTDVEELNAIALIHNVPSNKVIQKVGFQFKAKIAIDGHEYNHYKIKKSLWF